MPELVPVRSARRGSQTATIARPKRRGALLASTAFTGAFAAAIAGHPTSALAACSGVNTANVLCDAANQATAGALGTSFAGTTTVNVNPGGKIDTGGASATVTAPGSLTFNNNDTIFGINGTATPGISLRNDFGAITYLGNAGVTATAVGANALSAIKVGGSGDITITANETAASAIGTGIAANHAGTGNVVVTNNATTTGFTSGITVGHTGSGNILVTGSGNVIGTFNGIVATHMGTSGGITISGSGNASSPAATGILAVTSGSNGSDILINRSGNVSGGISAATVGTGKITVTGFGTVTSPSSAGILLLANGGDVSVTGGGNITTAFGDGISARTANGSRIEIAPAGVVLGTRGIAANTASFAGTGTTTITLSDSVGGTSGPGVSTLMGTGLATVNVTAGTVSAFSGPFGAGDGISHQGGGGFVLNMTGGRVGTPTLRTDAVGIKAIDSGAGGGIDITSTSVFSTGTGISAALSGATSRNIAITTNGVTDSSTGTGISAIISAGASGNITITQNGAVTGPVGITVVNGGSGAATVINRGSITGTSGFAVFVAGGNSTFVMDGPGAALIGSAFGDGTFRLAGGGSNSFDAGQIRPAWTLLDKTGSSNWTLTGTATYAGPVTVSEGTLSVNGSLASASGISVAPGATLGGSGTLPKTTINAGGSLAPGNSIGTVTISGSLTFVGAGNYVVEVAPAAADRTNVTGAPGTATLSGTLQAIGTGGSYTSGQRYTVLNATGGISGTFGTLAISGNFGLTRPHVEYDANNVYLVLDLNQISPSLTNATPNQRAVAGAADAAVRAGASSALFVSLFNLPVAQLSGALDQLSGEVHASTTGVLADESLYVRSAILGRLRQASYGGDMAAMAALSLGGPQVAFADAQPDRLLSYDAKSPRLPVKAAPGRAAPDVAFWAQGFGAWGRFDGDGNATTVRRDLAGIITGVDTRAGANGRLGIAAGYTGSRNALDGRGFANVETGHIAGYGGWSFGAFNLRAGGAYAFHSIATDRTIAFANFFDRAFANYDGSTGQVFGEFGYGFALGSVAVEPFAGAAWVRVKTDAAAERGGLAALNVAGTTFETGYATLGIRAASIVPLGAGMVLIPRATLAWQHAVDTVTPGNVLALQAAPAFPFAISGVPVARDSLLAEAGLDLAIGRNATIGVSYVGQIARNVLDHAAKGKFTWTF